MTTTQIIALISALFAVGLSLTIAFYERRSLPHWFFVAGMLVLGAESIFTGLTADVLYIKDVIYWQNWRMVMLGLLPGVWLMFSLIYARGDYGSFLSKWRGALAVAFIVPLAIVVGWHSELIVVVEDPTLKAPRSLGLTLPAIILNVIFLLSIILAMVNLESTFRAAVGTMRWRIKFMIMGLGVLFVVRAYTCSQNLLYYRSLDVSLQTLNAGALVFACVLIARSLARAGHFEVHVYPSQTVLHNSLTLLLAGLYLVVVGVFAKLVTWLGGNAAFQLKAFVILASLIVLAILLLSDRVRLYTQSFVSRHFQRPQYDYRAVWRTFAEGTARRVEQADLCTATVKLVSEVFQALSVTIWLVDESKENLVFAASTSHSEADAEKLKLAPADAAKVIAVLRENPRPVDIDGSHDDWAALLRRLHPDEFRKGGNRVCVPMMAGGEMLGLMLLGDRVAGVLFSFQDYDLLASAGDQAAVSLLNIQLSQRLSQAKQLEAFQAMSTFFVHDLKNTASTLSLMLQNLPVHFNDPSFREDALRGISKTVTRINDLIGRLSVLRREMTVQTVESDLNALISEALGGLAPVAGVEVVKELKPLPKVTVDPRQIQNVVTNLVLNATEAVGSNGQVKVETVKRNGWVVLSVTDNGCGISPEFVRRSLFRPFQTTKKKGIGIGMFQCKMIVEAHRGRIEVESELGKGTVFRVLLPSM